MRIILTYNARMATNEDSQGTSYSIDVQLPENDIPGASLKEPFESHTVSELRWWLLCRGIVVPTSWKKPQVIQKYVLIQMYYLWLKLQWLFIDGKG